MIEELPIEINKEDREKLSQLLDEYEKQLGLEQWKEQQAPSYLTMPIEQLRSKSPDELAEATFVLMQYGLNIQRAMNRSRVWERWAKNKINEVAAINIPKIANVGWQERMLMATHGSELSRKLQNFLFQVSARLDRLDKIPDHIRFISDAIREMKFIALRREKNAD